MKTNKPWGVLLVIWGARAIAVHHALAAIVHLEQGRHGKGLVDAGLCVLYLLFSTFDLEKLWKSRDLPVMQIASAERQSVQYYFAVALFYLLVISGAILQLFAD